MCKGHVKGVCLDLCEEFVWRRGHMMGAWMSCEECVVWNSSHKVYVVSRGRVMTVVCRN